MGQGENVRFSYRSHQDSIEVILQGDADWVNSLRSDLGLKGAIGFTRPLGKSTHKSAQENQSTDGPADSSNTKPTLPGPPPDPSRIPSVVRTIGDMDLSARASEIGMSSQTDPDMAALAEFIDEVDPPEPVSNVLSSDPLAEAWLQLVLTMVVREHGHTSMSLSDIEKLIGEKVNKNSTEIKTFLDRLWRIGKLERIHGGAEDHYAPNPSWLESH
tara:strand:- start:15097 stop:15741 length:645 start_codon:yes stop_codon:yes gene_type:complete